MNNWTKNSLTTKTWALVLAAGEGSRLRSLTTTEKGIAVPKQFCSLRGGPSLLQEALHRAASVAPHDRICAIVAAEHRQWWQGPLWSLPERNVIVQPANKGTAIGLLLPLLHIAERDPDARVVILPADHHVADESLLAQSLNHAAHQAGRRTDDVFMLGIEPEDADTELGYIVPAQLDLRGGLTVQQFVEKPSHTLARRLLEQGAMWNVFILAASVRALLKLFARRFPEILNEMRTAVQRDWHSVDDATTVDLYGRLPSLDFSRHVLEGQEAALRMLPVPHCGWTDLGTPKRVAETLHRIRTAEPHFDLAGTLASASSYLNLAAQHARLQLTG